MKYFITIMTIVILAASGRAENYASLNDKGNKAYDKGDVKKALDLYHQAEVERPETPEIFYNQANALSKDGNIEEALGKYDKALQSNDAKLQQMAHFNTGNAYFQKQEYMKAVESYKKALELNPGDVDAKYNLELARVMLKEQLKRQPQDKNQQQQQQDQKQQQQQQQQKQDDQKDQNGKNDQQQQQEGADQGKKDQKQQAAEEKQGKKDDMSKEDAMRILRAMGDSEKETQKAVKRQYSQSSYKGKDW
jgi:Ca-activated chloride channel family protein